MSPDAEQFVAQALPTLGWVQRTCGHWTHGLQVRRFFSTLFFCHTRSYAAHSGPRLVCWAMIQVGQVQFGVFSTSYFALLALSSDWTWPALSLSSVICHLSSGFKMTVCIIIFWWQTDLVTDGGFQLTGSDNFLWHRLLYSRGGSNWLKVMIFRDTQTSLLTGVPTDLLDVFIVTDPWWEVVSRGLRQEMTQKHKT